MAGLPLIMGEITTTQKYLQSHSATHPDYKLARFWWAENLCFAWKTATGMLTRTHRKINEALWKNGDQEAAKILFTILNISFTSAVLRISSVIWGWVSLHSTNLWDDETVG